MTDYVISSEIKACHVTPGSHVWCPRWSHACMCSAWSTYASFITIELGVARPWRRRKASAGAPELCSAEDDDDGGHAGRLTCPPSVGPTGQNIVTCALMTWKAGPTTRENNCIYGRWVKKLRKVCITFVYQRKNYHINTRRENRGTIFIKWSVHAHKTCQQVWSILED